MDTLKEDYLAKELGKVLGQKLDQEGYELVDLIPISSSQKNGAKGGLKVTTLEDLFEDFDDVGHGSDEKTSYVIRLRSKSVPVLVQKQAVFDGVYMPNGKLNSDYLVKNAELLMKGGEFELAKNILQTLEKAGERPAYVHRSLGRCSESEGNFEAATNFYEESITFQPSIDVYESLSKAYLKTGKFEDAIDSMKRSLTMREMSASKKAEVYASLALIYQRRKENKLAKAAFENALNSAPSSEAVSSNFLSFLLDTKDYEAAKPVALRLLQQKPDELAFFAMGICEFNLANPREAHDWFVKCLDRNPANSQAVFYLVKCAYDIKSYSAAARCLAVYTDVSPVNANIFYSLAGLQYHLGRWQEARDTITRIFELDRNHHGAIELAKLLEQTGH